MLSEITNEVLAPVATADDGNVLLDKFKRVIPRFLPHYLLTPILFLLRYGIISPVTLSYLAGALASNGNKVAN